MRKHTLFATLLLMVSALAKADTIVLDFEGLNDGQSVLNYYNGGLAGNGVGPGPNYGITFSPNALSIVGVLENEALLPSGGNGLFFLTGAAATMNVPAGFTTGFSFYYSAPFFAGTIRVYSGLNDTGTLLASLSLPTTTNGAGVVAGCDSKNFCPYFPIGVSFAGTAMSVDFGGTVNQIVFDNITLGSSVPVSGSPEPATFLLTLPAGLGLMLIARRRHQIKQFRRS